MALSTRTFSFFCFRYTGVNIRIFNAKLNSIVEIDLRYASLLQNMVVTGQWSVVSCRTSSRTVHINILSINFLAGSSVI